MLLILAVVLYLESFKCNTPAVTEHLNVDKYEESRTAVTIPLFFTNSNWQTVR